MPQVNGTTSADPLDSADYDPIDHLNSIFSHPSTLSSAPKVSRALASYQYELDNDITSLEAKQATSDEDSIQRIKAAQAELADLLEKIENVRERALQTEQTITEMTADIKRLDGTKRNLTLSMTALKRLQMLTTAYEQLRNLCKTRQYKECAQLLQAVVQLMAHFKSYRSIDQIAVLGRKVADLQREMLEQVSEDFETAFSKGEVVQKRAMLGEACLVMDSLGENARSRLITWYCNTSLREYRQIFRGIDEAGSLDNISRRYSWFTRMLKTYDQEHASIFPAHWKVNEMLANAFCEGTRDDFKTILQRSARRTDGQTLDVNLLLSCLQQTLDFEHALDRRLADDPRPSTDTNTSIDDKPAAFEHSISEAFEPYLSLWVEAQDRELSTMLPTYRRQLLRNTDEEFSPQLVIPSSPELFQFYRLTLAQCAKLSTGGRLLELSRTFAKYLDQYSQDVLFYSLGERFGQQGPPVEDIVVILNTADYCYTTCTQLEDKIKQRIDDDFKDRVDLQSQGDAFMGISGAAVRALVRKVETECEPSWREMRNTAWNKVENVGDQSAYSGELIRNLNSKSKEILGLLHKHQYARAFCDQVVEALTNTYVSNILQCRTISEAGAEQMLLDSYALKKSLTNMPNLTNPDESSPPQPAYAKRVANTTAKIDPLLKTLQVRPSPPEALVQAYLIHIGDRSEANFRRVLDLKGVTRKQDQSHLVELFNAHRVSQSETLVASSPIFGQVNGSPYTGASNGVFTSNITTSMSVPNLANLSTATSFGSAILNAAKDGVDRLGAPTMNASIGLPAANHAASAVPSRVATPMQSDAPAVNLNDNLRSFGKFFKRDMGSFPRFGGGGSGRTTEM